MTKQRICAHNERPLWHFSDSWNTHEVCCNTSAHTRTCTVAGCLKSNKFIPHCKVLLYIFKLFPLTLTLKSSLLLTSSSHGHHVLLIPWLPCAPHPWSSGAPNPMILIELMYVSLCFPSSVPPTLTLPTSPTTIILDSDAQLLCAGSGKPLPSVQWIVRNAPSFPPGHVEIARSRGPDQSLLLIHNVTYMDDGIVYMCNASNEVSSALGQITVAVRGGYNACMCGGAGCGC